MSGNRDYAEGIWETIKCWETEFNWDRRRYRGFDSLGNPGRRFQLLDIPFQFLLGNLLTGLLISRGANFIHDLFSTLNLGEITART